MRNIGFLPLVLFLAACHSSQKAVVSKDDGKIEVVVIQINDVYEITPLEGGNAGGMARVAQVKKEYLAKNPNTLLIHAGDFVSPSIFGGLSYEGKGIKGRQMVEAMNVAGVDIATFGNHEFDIKEPDLESRINESTFEWVSSNVVNVKDGKEMPFKRNGVDLPQSLVRKFKDADGTEISIGFWGITLPSNPQKYVKYYPLDEAAKRETKNLSQSCDVIVGITHQDSIDDIRFLKEIPEVPLFLGGHDHKNMRMAFGKSSCTKADANAKTAWVHVIAYNKKTKTHNISSKLINLDKSVVFEPSTEALVEKWKGIAYSEFNKQGFNPDVAVTKLNEPLDARETTVRYRPCPATQYIVKAISKATPLSDCALMNTGSVRVDDVLYGSITELDVIRMLPFGGGVVEVDMKGGLLLEGLKEGLVQNKGLGGYLALDKVDYDEKKHTASINGKPLSKDAVYRVAMPDFLLKGLDVKVFSKDNPGIVKIHENNPALSDIRKLLIAFFK